MNLKSSAFIDGETIPRKYGYKFENFNPPLTIENVPKNTKYLVLIMDDPDAMAAVGKVWVHWVLWNIPPNTTEILENSIPSNAIEGITDFGEIGYGGPAPPDKEHRYIFSLYAIDVEVKIESGSSKENVLKNIKNHIVEYTKLTGKFAPL